MNLIDNMKTACVRVTAAETPDGEGGRTTVWTEGSGLSESEAFAHEIAPQFLFYAAIVHDRSMQARVAEKQGVTSTYTVTADKNVTLGFGDVFKRVSDGKIFRVTSDCNDVQTPDCASFAFRQVTAEEWRLTHDNTG